tara:strand:- start:456 stop:632 length:177 start_codon:yes stop_codon:yes gene_type:complete
MPNLSYCRFRNTLTDLKDCLEAIEYEPIDTLSDEELEALKQMFNVCEEIVNYKPLIKC